MVYQSVCNLLLLEMRAKRLYLRPSYLIGLDWIGLLKARQTKIVASGMAEALLNLLNFLQHSKITMSAQLLLHKSMDMHAQLILLTILHTPKRTLSVRTHPRSYHTTRNSQMSLYCSVLITTYEQSKQYIPSQSVRTVSTESTSRFALNLSSNLQPPETAIFLILLPLLKVNK